MTTATSTKQARRAAIDAAAIVPRAIYKNMFRYRGNAHTASLQNSAAEYRRQNYVVSAWLALDAARSHRLGLPIASADDNAYCIFVSKHKDRPHASHAHRPTTSGRPLQPAQNRG